MPHATPPATPTPAPALRLVFVALALLLTGFDRPALDDFYARSRTRGDDFDSCVFGYCEQGKLLQLLLGAQVANPSTDRLRPLLAEGLRLGMDAGWMYDGASVVRTQVWVDWLREHESGVAVTDLWWRTTAFHALEIDRNDLSLHFFADVVTASRDELQPTDFADLQVSPYRVLDVETEVAYVGPEIDKDGRLAIPLGVSWRRRWNLDDTAGHVRRGLSGAVALRGAPRGIKHHYQLDFARLSRVDWETGLGPAHAWRLTAGYQRLSPGIDELDIWLLGGYGWHEGEGAQSGWLAQLGAQLRTSDEDSIGIAYEAWFALDPRTRRFGRVHRFEGTLVHESAAWRYGTGVERVSVGDVGRLWTLTLHAGWRPPWLYGLMLGSGLRVALSDDSTGGAAPDTTRFNVQLDWLF